MRSYVFAVGAALALVCGAAPAGAETLQWEEAFPTSQAPPRVYFKARYRDAQGAEHVLESWRDGTRLLHRNTDRRVDLYLARTSVRGTYRYRLVDHARRSVIDVDRGNLYRIGVFADWPVLSHVLDRPHLSGKITTMRDSGVAAVAPCHWRAISQADAPQFKDEICWSTAWALPLVIRRVDTGHTNTVEAFRVTELRVPNTKEFGVGLPPPPAGYKYVDANRDIAPDSD